MKKLLSSLSITMSLLLLFSLVIQGLNSRSTLAATPAYMLQSIVSSAKNGKVINCNFSIKTKIEDVINVWGKPDLDEYIAAAKGSYATYNRKNIVFGYHFKFQQIFEVRNMDTASLKTITFKDIQKYLGKPQYESKDNIGRRIIGYKISDEYKLEFILQNSTSTAQLHHYNVFYPLGTTNSMARDLGRQW